MDEREALLRSERLTLDARVHAPQAAKELERVVVGRLNSHSVDADEELIEELFARCLFRRNRVFNFQL